MGNYLTRSRNIGEDHGDGSSQNAYRYPPKTGSYFGTHFIMGGERFESPQPGEYLFGDSEELNFLGSKPVPFPYPVPSGNDPTKTLKALVYIRKDSLRLIKSPNISQNVEAGDTAVTNTPYNIEFVFDADVKCSIRIHYFATEDLANGQILYHVKDSSMSSEKFHYSQGAGQHFSQPTHTLEPAKFPEEDWAYSFEKDVYPIAIHCTVDEEENAGHAHMTYAVLERGTEGTFSIKPLKQKQLVDGLTYLLQEIYGIENKNMERIKDTDPDDDIEDSGAECVICMSDMRDTLILPCRHLCLCSTCADSLRYQASMCPICRVKFRALLQIRAMRKKSPPNNSPQSDSEDSGVNQEGVPHGYEAISLIEALNGQVVPPINHDGVHLQITVGSNLYALEKKGQKDHKKTVPGPIEYQKEMDTDKESSKGTLEKKKDKDKDKVVLTHTMETSTQPVADLPPDEVVPIKVRKETAPKPLKSTMVTVRCSTDGSMTTETKISPVRETQLITNTQRTSERSGGPYKTNIAIGRMTCGLSTGDMADDEREDSSEPEADYDESDDLEVVTSPSDCDLYAVGSLAELTEMAIQQEHQDKLSAAECGENYDTLLTAGLTDVNSGSSSFGSDSSGQALLNVAEVTEVAVGERSVETKLTEEES